MTLVEFERSFSITIVAVYPQRRHYEFGVTPLQKHEEGICGTAERPGRGLRHHLLDERRLRFDFMSYETRTVQRQGLVIDEMQYNDDVLRPWGNATDPSDAPDKRQRRFIVRRDPRDISRVYFYDPELKQYFEISYRPYRPLADERVGVARSTAPAETREPEGHRRGKHSPRL